MHKRHKKKSTLVTPNWGFSEWRSFVKNDHLTAAWIDRLTENSHVSFCSAPTVSARRLWRTCWHAGAQPAITATRRSATANGAGFPIGSEVHERASRHGRHGWCRCDRSGDAFGRDGLPHGSGWRIISAWSLRPNGRWVGSLLATPRVPAKRGRPDRARHCVFPTVNLASCVYQPETMAS
jgi:hypothetical protein